MCHLGTCPQDFLKWMMLSLLLFLSIICCKCKKKKKAYLSIKNILPDSDSFVCITWADHIQTGGPTFFPMYSFTCWGAPALLQGRLGAAAAEVNLPCWLTVSVVAVVFNGNYRTTTNMAACHQSVADVGLGSSLSAPQAQSSPLPLVLHLQPAGASPSPPGQPSVLRPGWRTSPEVSKHTVFSQKPQLTGQSLKLGYNKQNIDSPLFFNWKIFKCSL